MNIGLGIGLPFMLRGAGASIRALFANGEQGVWYDPSDLSTLYQDAAGTSPVTAVGQPVGLVLDKRLGLVRGAELIVNGDNEAALLSGPLGAVSSINATVARAAAPGGGFAMAVSPTGGTVAHHAILYLAANKAYEISARVYVPTGSIATARLFDAVDGSWLGPTSTLKDQWVTLRGIRPIGKAASWAVGIGENSNSANIDGQVFYIDDLSVRELPGNHATQPTAINRPVLQQDGNGKYYLAFNGTNSWMQTASIDFTATDKMTVVTGLLKASTSTGIPFESAGTFNGSDGGYGLILNDASPSDYFGFRGVGVGNILGKFSNAAPSLSVISAVMQQAAATNAEKLRTRRNGVDLTLAYTNSLAAAGTFANGALCIGSRIGGTLPFSGGLYGLIIRGALSSDPQIASAERYMSRKAGVTL